jgi:hypothetical protein
MASGSAPVQRVDDVGKLERGSQKASLVRVALGADAVGGRTNSSEHFPEAGRLRRHACRRAARHCANPFDGRDHVPVAGAGKAGLIEKSQHVRKRCYDPILVHGAPPSGAFEPKVTRGVRR